MTTPKHFTPEFTLYLMLSNIDEMERSGDWCPSVTVERLSRRPGMDTEKAEAALKASVEAGEAMETEKGYRPSPKMKQAFLDGLKHVEDCFRRDAERQARIHKDPE